MIGNVGQFPMFYMLPVVVCQVTLCDLPVALRRVGRNDPDPQPRAHTRFPVDVERLRHRAAQLAQLQQLTALSQRKTPEETRPKAFVRRNSKSLNLVRPKLRTFNSKGTVREDSSIGLHHEFACPFSESGAGER